MLTNPVFRIDLADYATDYPPPVDEQATTDTNSTASSTRCSRSCRPAPISDSSFTNTQPIHKSLDRCARTSWCRSKPPTRGSSQLGIRRSPGRSRRVKEIPDYFRADAYEDENPSKLKGAFTRLMAAGSSLPAACLRR